VGVVIGVTRDKLLKIQPFKGNFIKRLPANTSVIVCTLHRFVSVYFLHPVTSKITSGHIKEYVSIAE